MVSDADREIRLRLAAFGRGDERAPVAAGVPVAEANRVEIRREGLPVVA